MQQLPQEIQHVAPYLDRYGYLAVFGGILLEDFGLPAPGETLLIAGAAFAGVSGKLSIWLVALLGFLGAVVGDNIGFAIGHFGGRRLVLKFGRYVLITEKRLDRAEEFFDRHGGKVVLFARFVEGLRQLNGIASGVFGMHWRRFLVFNISGAALWVVFWVVVGYFFGNQLNAIDEALGPWGFFLVFTIAPILTVGLAVAYHFLIERRHKGS
jgi:membrane protein DedA with SNARE-associated domain